MAKHQEIPEGIKQFRERYPEIHDKIIEEQKDKTKDSGKKSEMKRHTIWLSPTQIQDIKVCAAVLDLSPSQFVRVAVSDKIQAVKNYKV